MSDKEKSLSDEATFDGGMQADEKDLQSLGNRSTLGGKDGSSISDLGSVGELPDHDMEIVDLSKRYRIGKSLGKGGMGEVLLATDTRLDRQVAIKRIRADIAVGKTAAARFLQEAKAVASLSHPNIVSVHDYGRDSDGPFLIMEYVAGGSLLQRCKEGPIELEEAIDLVCQLCDGLGRAHDAGIIHRDIKPANILLTNDGIPKLTDFGLAKADSRDHTMTMAGAVLGTLDFMPPEQRQDAALADSRSDLWSLSATLYQMVTGEPPRVIDLDSVPQQLRAILSLALKTKKEDRYQTAAELGAALRDAKSLQAIWATDLDEGQCASCGVKNPSSRKFCKECAAALWTNCLTCESSIQIWEKVCGDCGCIQEEILAQRREAMKARRLEAEESLQNLEFDNARQIATEIQNEPDVRLGQLKTWSTEFLEEIDATWKREQDRADELLSEAIKHESAKDYEAAIRTLTQVAGTFRNAKLPGQNETVASVLDRLIAIQDRLEGLEKKVHQQVKQRQLEGLMVAVETLIELAPDREDFRKLKDQLIAREEKITRRIADLFMQAEELLSGGNPRAALNLLAKVDSKRLLQSQAELKEKLSGLVASEDSLISSVQAAKADGVIGLHEIDSLLPKVNAFLTSIPNHASALQLLRELKERRDKLTEDRSIFFAEALDAYNQQDYLACLESLLKIDPSLVVDHVRELRESAECLHDRVKELDSKIKHATKSKQSEGVIELLDEYLSLKKDDNHRVQLRENLAKQVLASESNLIRAQEFFLNCQNEAAIRELEAIPKFAWNENVVALRHRCFQAKRLRESAVASLTIQEENVKNLITREVDAYQDFLNKNSVADTPFSDLLSEFAAIYKRHRAKDIALKIAALPFVLLGTFSGQMFTMIWIVILSMGVAWVHKTMRQAVSWSTAEKVIILPALWIARILLYFFLALLSLAFLVDVFEQVIGYMRG